MVSESLQYDQEWFSWMIFFSSPGFLDPIWELHWSVGVLINFKAQQFPEFLNPFCTVSAKAAMVISTIQLYPTVFFLTKVFNEIIKEQNN